MPLARLFWLLAFGLLALAIGISVAVYDTLPATIPTGLDASGRGHGASPRSLPSVLALPLILSATVLLMAWFSRVVHRYPTLVSMPGIEAWRDLPLEARARTAAPIRAFLAFTASTVAGVAALTQWALLSAARGNRAEWILPLVVIAGILPLPIGLGLIMRDFEDAVKAEARRAPEPTPRA